MRRSALIAVLLLLLLGAFLLGRPKGPVQGPGADLVPVAVPGRVVVPGPAPAFRSGFLEAPGADVAPPAAPGALRGKVVDRQGAGVPGARVAILGPDGSSEIRAAAGGEFAFLGLASGDYALTATHQGMAASPLTGVPLGAGETLSGLVLTLDAGAEVDGRVCDAQDGGAVAEAAISLACGPIAATLIAGRDGRFAARGLPGGACSIAVSAPEFSVREEEFFITPGQRVRGLKICLTRGGVLAGKVLAEGGAPLAGAWVAPWVYQTGQLKRAQAQAVVTRADGSFRIVAVPPGRVLALASARGWAPSRSREVDLSPGQVIEGLAIQLSPGGAIAGTVKDAGGRPVAASIEVVELSSGRFGGVAAQAADGSFRVDGIPPGRYAVAASSGEARALAPAVDVTDREETVVDLVLGGKTLHGRVADQRYQPLAGATVRATPEGAGGAASRMATTDARGDFAFGGLPDGTWTVWAEAPGSASEERRGVEPGGAPLVFLLRGGGTIEGVVTDAAGAPVGDFTIVIAPSPAPAGPVGGRYRYARALAPDGAFRFEDLPPGRYRVRADGLAFAPSEQDGIEVPEGGVARVRFSLGRGATVQGKVVAEGSGAPIPGALVGTSWWKLYAWGHSDEVPGRWTRAGADGSFRMEGLPVGELRMVAGAENPEGLELKVTLREGGVEDWILRLRPSHHGATEEEFGGIGCSIRADKGQVFVNAVFEGGPAFRAGLRAGDRIVGIDGQPVPADVRAVTERIRGPVGSKIVMSLHRPETNEWFVTVIERVRVVL